MKNRKRKNNTPQPPLNLRGGKEIKVRAYAGFRGEESPRSFSLDERQITVVEILDRWIEEDVSDKTRKRFFVVKGDDIRIYKLYTYEKTFEWFVEED